MFRFDGGSQVYSRWVLLVHLSLCCRSLRVSLGTINVRHSKCSYWWTAGLQRPASSKAYSGVTALKTLAGPLRHRESPVSMGQRGRGRHARFMEGPTNMQENLHGIKTSIHIGEEWQDGEYKDNKIATTRSEFSTLPNHTVVFFSFLKAIQSRQRSCACFLALTVAWHTARDFHLCMKPSFVRWCGPLNHIIPF